MKRILSLSLFVAVILLFPAISRAEEMKRFSLTLLPRVETGVKFGEEEGYRPNFGFTTLFSNFHFQVNDNFSISMNNRWLTTSPGDLYTELGNPKAVNWLDILNFSYSLGKWHFSAGKLYIRTGGFEFECPSPEFHHNVMSCWWMNIQPYTWGVSVGYDVAWGNRISVNVNNSPYSEKIFYQGLMSYGLSWDGNVGPVQTYWGANIIQRQDRSFVKELGLGQRLVLGNYTAELDYTVRSDAWNTLFSRESTLTLNLGYEGRKWFQIHLKGGWEFTTDSESLLSPGTVCPSFANEYIPTLALDPERPYFFGGFYVYFFPIRNNHNLRLHLTAAANNYYRGAAVNAGILYRLDIRF